MKRVFGALVSLLFVGALTFALLELAPGDAASVRLGTTATTTSRAALREALGVQGGVATRAWRYLGHGVRLDLGRSLVDGRPVRTAIAERLPRTLILALVAFALAWMIALPLAAWRRRSIDIALALLYALPVPSLAIALLAMGAPYGGNVASTVCAALCILPLLVPRVHGQLVRALDDALASDALRTLRAAGAERLYGAALRMEALRLVTFAALQLPALISGAALVEAIFGLPGLGLLALDALASRDVPMLLGLVLVGALVTIGATLLVDLLGPRFDPRLRAP